MARPVVRIYAIANQKGGVGKTTTAVNLAASLAAMGCKVLLVDIDPQGNATLGSGVGKHALEASVVDVLMQRRATRDCVIAAPTAGYDLLGSNDELIFAEIQLMNIDEGREFRLREGLRPLRDDYDYILIDCPPTLSALTINALVASHGVVVPTQCEYYALEGLSSLTKTIERLRETVNPGLQIEGVLRTMFDSRNNLARDVSEQLRQHFGRELYESAIPRNVTLAEAPSHGLAALQYDKNALGTRAYLMLAGEILNRDATRTE